MRLRAGSAVAPFPRRGFGMGVSEGNDWEDTVFIDKMKGCRTWSASGGGTDADIIPVLDANGWPQSIPGNMTGILRYVLTDGGYRGQDTSYRGGTFRLRWNGVATITVGGGLSLVTTVAPGDLRVSLNGSSGAAWFTITSIGNPHPTSITLVRETDLAAHAAGELFDPLWLAPLQFSGVSTVRLMGWSPANTWAPAVPLTSWSQIPTLAGHRWYPVPPVVHAALGNKLNSNIWTCLSVAFDDTAIENWATAIRDHLDPDLLCYFELSNEVWNYAYGFSQTEYADTQANALWGINFGHAQWYGYRNVQIHAILSDVFAGQRHRWRLLAATQTGNSGESTQRLLAPAWQSAGTPIPYVAPHTKYDAWAFTGYISYNELPAFQPLETQQRTELLNWLSQGQAHFTTRVAQETEADRLLKIAGAFPAEINRARQYNMTPMIYEWNNHNNLIGTAANEATLVDALEIANYTPEMATTLANNQDWLHANGVVDPCFFYLVGRHSQYGSWGGMRTLNDYTRLNTLKARADLALITARL